jgi:hypothetical protein
MLWDRLQIATLPLRRLLSSARLAEKASVFTGKPEFYETLFLLDDLLIKIEKHHDQHSITSTTALQPKWLNRENMQVKLGFDLSLLEYRQIRQRLARIAAAAPASQNIVELVQVFSEAADSSWREALANESQLASVSDSASVPTSVAPPSTSTAYIDELGRAVAIGRRKTSTAKVIVVPGDGQFRVNGRELHEHFHRLRDLYAIAEPFRVAKLFGQFNVWALTKGGGQTGTLHSSSRSLC